MNSLDLNQRRRAIYTGLIDFLDDEQMERALRHWENRYADQPSLALQRFVADICADSELRTKRPAVLRSLLNAMHRPANELLPDPGGSDPVMQPPAANSGSAFSALMLALMSQLSEDKQGKLRLDLFAALRRRQLPPTLLDALQRWLASRHPLELQQAPTALLQKLINQYYVLLCEDLGPIQADRMLALAVKQVQKEQPTLDKFLSELL